MPFTEFEARTHGFHFPNLFQNHVIGNIVTTQGLCGRMAYAALDYFHAGIPVPTHNRDDFGPGLVAPPDGSRLYEYFYQRIVDSFANHWNLWMDVALNPAFKPARFTEKRLPELLGELDLGHPVPLGLINNTKLLQVGSNHQVVATGYEMSADHKRLTLHVYDNNSPDVDETLVTDPGDPKNIQYSGGGTWIGFFLLPRYRPHVPTYIDLGLDDGLDVAFSGQSKRLDFPRLNIQVNLPALHVHPAGKPLSAKMKVKNFGDYPAHWKSLVLGMTDPSGQETALGEEPVGSLASGQSIVMDKSGATTAGDTGTYEIRARYVTRQDATFDLSEVSAGTTNSTSVLVAPAGTHFELPHR